MYEAVFLFLMFLDARAHVEDSMILSLKFSQRVSKSIGHTYLLLSYNTHVCNKGHWELAQTFIVLYKTSKLSERYHVTVSPGEIS